MTGWLLDTNICIFAFRNEYDIAEKIKQYGKEKYKTLRQD